MTDAEMLAAVQTAINDIMLTGQSYTLDGQTITRADLGKLQEREQLLLKRIARAASCRRTAQADFRYSD